MKAVLVVFHKGKRREFPLTKPVTDIGRKPEATLQIPTADVSRQHCEIRVQGNGVVVKDLGSANGTYVNGKRIAEQKLDPGDQIAIGPVTFVLQVDGKPANIQPPEPTSTQIQAKSKASPTRKSAGPAGAVAAAGAGAAAAGDDDFFELGEADFDMDDPITALEKLEDEDDMP